MHAHTNTEKVREIQMFCDVQLSSLKRFYICTWPENMCFSNRLVLFIYCLSLSLSIWFESCVMMVLMDLVHLHTFYRGKNIIQSERRVNLIH